MPRELELRLKSWSMSSQLVLSAIQTHRFYHSENASKVGNFICIQHAMHFTQVQVTTALLWWTHWTVQYYTSEIYCRLQFCKLRSATKLPSESNELQLTKV